MGGWGESIEQHLRSKFFNFDIDNEQFYLNTRRENIKNMDERYQVMAGGRRGAEVLVDTVNKFVFHRNGVIGGVTR